MEIPKIPWPKNASASADERYQGGEAYADPKTLSTGLLEDMKAIGIKAGQGDIETLLKVGLTKGKPVDDKQMTVVTPDQSLIMHWC